MQYTSYKSNWYNISNLEIKNKLFPEENKNNLKI